MPEPRIYVALSSAYPDEDVARRNIESMCGPAGTCYGRWVHPTPEQPTVWLFSPDDLDPEQITVIGWKPIPADEDKP